VHWLLLVLLLQELLRLPLLHLPIHLQQLRLHSGPALHSTWVVHPGCHVVTEHGRHGSADLAGAVNAAAAKDAPEEVA
jgi:hypothetical protein